MKPHTTISAIYQPVLRQKLEQQGVIFIADDFIEPRDFLVELCVTSATHAIAHISVLEPRHRRELQAVRKANPRVCIIIIASVGTMKDKRLMDIFSEFNVRVVEDGSRSLVESIVKIIKETAQEETQDAVNEWTEPAEPQKQTSQPEPMPLTIPSKLLEKPVALKPPAIKLSKVKATPVIPPAAANEVLAATKEALPQAEYPPAPPVEVSAPVAQITPAHKKTNKKRLPRPTVPVVIPVFSGSRGAGCTWLAIQIGHYIALHGYAVTVCGASDLLLMGPRYVRAGDTHFTAKNVDFYPYLKPSDLISTGYDYIIFDVGLVMDFEPDGTSFQTATAADMQEVMRAPCKVLVTEIGLWRQNALMQLLSNRVWQQLAQTSSIAASCRASGSAISALERQYKTQFVRLPIAEPFDTTAEVTQAVELLLQPLFK